MYHLPSELRHPRKGHVNKSQVLCPELVAFLVYFVGAGGSWRVDRTLVGRLHTSGMQQNRRENEGKCPEARP